MPRKDRHSLGKVLYNPCPSHAVVSEDQEMLLALGDPHHL